MSFLERNLGLVVALFFLFFVVSIKMAMASEQNVKVSAELSHPYLDVSAKHPQLAYLKIGLKGEDYNSDLTRPSMNIALVLDKSGSMSGKKLSDLRDAAKMLVDRLNDRDILSIITYDNEPQILVPAAPLRNPDRVKRLIDSFGADGGTALYAGVNSGAKQIRKFISDSKINRVILLSDGHANSGPSSSGELASLGSDLIQEGISVSTIGLGLDFNEDLMIQLAARSDGFHQFAERSEDLSKFFDWEFGKIATIVANDIDIEIELAKGVRPVKILNRDGNVKGNKVYTKMNQIFSDHEIYFLLEVEIQPNTMFDDTISIARTRVSYYDLAMENRNTQYLATNSIPVFDPGTALKMQNRDVMIAAIEQKGAWAQREAITFRDQGKVKEAQAALEEMADTMNQASTLFGSTKLKEYADQLKEHSRNIIDDAKWKKNRKLNASQLNAVDFSVG